MVLQRRLDKITNVVKSRQSDVVVVIEDVHDPHNAEAIFRTCDAFGVQEVYLIFEKERAWNPKKIGKQSSSSAHKWLDFHTFNSTKECFGTLKKKRYSIVGSVVGTSAKSIFECTFPEKTALVMGNEHSGLSDVALSLCDLLVTIPMRGMLESLNVSVSTALFLYELTRQRIASGTLRQLSTSEQAALIDSFVTRSSKGIKRAL